MNKKDKTIESIKNTRVKCDCSNHIKLAEVIFKLNKVIEWINEFNKQRQKAQSTLNNFYQEEDYIKGPISANNKDIVEKIEIVRNNKTSFSNNTFNYTLDYFANLEESIKNKLNDITYICSECAETLGGEWPKHHVATFHQGECEVCGEDKGLSNVGDWNWPDGLRRGMRD